MGTRSAIDAFWAWWHEARHRVAESITTRSTATLADEISEKVNALGDNLVWELGPGVEAAHAFCVSAQGDPELRAKVELWLASAPAPDATWEYHPSRQANPGFDQMRLDLGGHELAFSDLSFGIELDESRERIDVEVHHALFKQMPEDVRGQITFIALDNLLGEDGVERWLGSVQVAVTKPEESVNSDALSDAVQKLQKGATGDRWAVLRGTTADGNLVFITANLALKRIDHPLLDVHGAVSLKLRTPTPEGLTSPEEADVLNQLEDELIGDLGDSAIHAARETLEGRRVLHLFTAESGRAPAVVDHWMKRHPEYTMSINWQRDPYWRALSRWA